MIVTCEWTVTPLCPFDVDCARLVSFGSGAGPTDVVPPSVVELDGVEDADSDGWEDASANCPVSVEVATDVTGTPVMVLSVESMGASPPDFVDACGSLVDDSTVTVIFAVLLDVVSLSKSL